MSDSDVVTAGELSRHLDAVYDAEVVSVEALDLGTFRVDRVRGDSWVARVFPAERPIERTRGDAEILRLLAELEFPAERCASAEPVSAIAEGSLLVTEFVPGSRRRNAGKRSVTPAACERSAGSSGGSTPFPLTPACSADRVAPGTTSPTAPRRPRSPH